MTDSPTAPLWAAAADAAAAEQVACGCVAALAGA